MFTHDDGGAVRYSNCAGASDCRPPQLPAVPALASTTCARLNATTLVVEGSK